MEDVSQEGQDKEEQQEKGNIKSEENAVEMSEDFDGQMHDGDENEEEGGSDLEVMGAGLQQEQQFLNPSERMFFSR